MRVVLVSNYINHHQIPFCEALYESLGEDFTFVQTMPMEEERVRMGWGVDEGTLSYVLRLYEQEAAAMQKILDADVAILGWTEREDVDTKRLQSGKLTFRLSERIYREGRWKAVSPRGLIHKYEEHIRYRNAEAYLLCAGAYVADDFKLIHAYPDKMFRFGYFPPVRTYTEEALHEMKRTQDGGLRLLYAGRMLELKRPDYCLRAAAECLEAGLRFHLDMVGDGPVLKEMEALAQSLKLQEHVTFHGMMAPDAVRAMMERAHMFLFPSNHLEGWGAVVNEAMNSACLVVASREAGCVPWLIRNGENGLVFDNGSFTDFSKQVQYGMEQTAAREAMGCAAYETIREEWNAAVAAERFLHVSEGLLDHDQDVFVPGSGPMSRA